jgi:general stress protein 26
LKTSNAERDTQRTVMGTRTTQASSDANRHRFDTPPGPSSCILRASNEEPNMADAPDNYEQVSIYPVDDDVQLELLQTQIECVFNWATKDGWPMGVIMSCYWHEGRMWLTTGANRHRVSAMRRDPRCSVVVTSTGTKLGGGKTVTIKGRCIIHEDRETKDWFYPAFASHLNPDPAGAETFRKGLDSPLRLIFEIVPEKFITYDGLKMFQHSLGNLDESTLGEPKSSDTVRLSKEMEKRGLK